MLPPLSASVNRRLTASCGLLVAATLRTVLSSLLWFTTADNKLVGLLHHQVMFVYNDLDEFVMQNLGSFDGKTLLSIESNEANAALQAFSKDDKKEEDEKEEEAKLGSEEVDAVTDWMAKVLA